jgi:endonuclease/exonuclease/phosphatase family metal-dependent hydrolase
VTYNVHGCIGTDGRLSEERIGDLLASVEPDVVALQELDVGRERSSRGHQPEKIASRLAMNFLFCPSVRDGDEHYGHAVMSRLPIRLVQSEELPRAFWPHPSEPRSALWAELEGPARLQLIATHLGLSPIERRRQTRALLSERWMGSPRFRGPRVLCGDMNTGPWSLTYLKLRASIRDVHRELAGLRARPTYPSRRPVFRLDHVFASRDVRAESAAVLATSLARVASDHLPLVVDLAFDASGDEAS